MPESSGSSILAELQAVAKMNLQGILLATTTNHKQQEVLDCFLLAMTKLRSIESLESLSISLQRDKDTAFKEEQQEEDESNDSSSSSFVEHNAHDTPQPDTDTRQTAAVSTSFGHLLKSILLDCQNEDETDTFYLLPRALHVHVTTAAFTFDPYVVAVALGGAIVYNLALFTCLQQQPNSNNSFQQQQQQQYSLQLFRLAYETFASVATTTNTSMILGCLASINNMGTLYSRSFQKEQTQECADILSRHVILLEQEEEDCCFHHFNMNILCNQVAHFRAAGMA